MTDGMKTRTIQYLALALLLGACQKETQESQDASPMTENGTCAPEIIAEIETGPATKTMISVDENGTGTIWWKPGDQINVFYGTTSTCYTAQNEENTTTAVFRTTDIIGSTESASDNIWGLYPYIWWATCDGTSVTTYLSENQTAVPETFDDDLFITLAHSDDTSLKFYNVCGGIKFSLNRSDITSVTFRGNNDEDLAGDISLTFDEQTSLPKATVIDGLKEITLTPPYGQSFERSVNYYIVCLPVTLSGGFTITFTTEHGTQGTFEYTANPVTIKRSVFGRKANFDSYATFVGVNILHYTSSEGQLTLPDPDCFGANIVSHTFADGVGTITFDSPVSAIGDGAFSECTGLTSIELDGLASIGENAFYGCTGLTSIDIPDSVTSIAPYAFSGSGLTSASVGSLVEMDYGPLRYLSMGTSLSSVTIRDGVTRIGDEAFWCCSDLASIVIPDSVTSIGNSAFSGCSSLTSFDLPANVTNYGDAPFYGSGLTTVVFPEGITSISESLFEGCYSLSSVIIPDSVTSIGDDAFSYCTSLTSIDIPSNVTSIGNSAFSYSGLISIEIPNGCTAIESLTFVGCESLTDVIIPNSVTSIGMQAFQDCTSLTAIDIPGSVTDIGSSAFAYSGLISVTIPYGVTSINCFNGCSSLTTVHLPETLTSIGGFYGCSNLSLIAIPNNVTNIERYAFNECSSLTSITIPTSVESIGDNAFGYCTGLVEIICLPTTPPDIIRNWYSWDSFDNTNDCPIYVPATSVEAYRLADGWSDYASRIQAMP